MVVRVLVVDGTLGMPRALFTAALLSPALLLAAAGVGAVAAVGRTTFADGAAADGAPLRDAGALVAPPPSPGAEVADGRPPAPFGEPTFEGWPEPAAPPPPEPLDPPPALALRALAAAATPAAATARSAGARRAPGRRRVGRVSRAAAHRDARQEPERDEHQPDQHLGEPARAAGFEPLLVKEVAVDRGVLLERVLGRDRFRRRVVVWSGHACGPPGPSIGPR